jgi:hypothetical protein
VIFVSNFSCDFRALDAEFPTRRSREFLIGQQGIFCADQVTSKRILDEAVGTRLGLANASALPPEPFGVVAAPGLHTIVILLDHHSEADARLAIAAIAELMHAEHFRLSCVLREGRRCSPYEGRAQRRRDYDSLEHRRFLACWVSISALEELLPRAPNDV